MSKKLKWCVTKAAASFLSVALLGFIFCNVMSSCNNTGNNAKDRRYDRE